jgi:hypothetical protein
MSVFNMKNASEWKHRIANGKVCVYRSHYVSNRVNEGPVNEGIDS